MEGMRDDAGGEGSVVGEELREVKRRAGEERKGEDQKGCRRRCEGI